MYRMDDPDPWRFGGNNDAGVNFVVSCLLRDGLQAAPFTAHSDGDGQLRALGLTSQQWSEWLHEVVRRKASFAQSLVGGLRWFPIPHFRTPKGAGNPFDVPGALPADRQLRGAVRRHWKEWRRRPGGAPLPGEIPGPLSPRLYHDLRASTPRPPYLIVHLVDYPSVVVDEIAPGSLVVGRPVPMDNDMYESAVRRGFAALTSEDARPA